MRRLLLCVGFAFLLTACTTTPIPDGYGGPVATVQDTAVSETANRGQFFYLDEVDGRSIRNVLNETRVANSGRGFSLAPVMYGRQVPAGKTTLTLRARVAYGAPIQEMMNASTLYSTKKTVNVTLESNKSYAVKGVLTKERQDVWLEDQTTGTRVE